MRVVVDSFFTLGPTGNAEAVIEAIQRVVAEWAKDRPEYERSLISISRDGQIKAHLILRVPPMGEADRMAESVVKRIETMVLAGGSRLTRTALRTRVA